MQVKNKMKAHFTSIGMTIKNKQVKLGMMAHACH
jgi:hypothetical protein